MCVRDINQAAKNEGSAVVLDAIGGYQVNLATKQGLQAIGQMNEAEADGLCEARQQVHVAAGCLLLGGKGAEQLQRTEPKLGGKGREVLSQHRQHVIAAGAGGVCRGRHRLARLEW